MKLKDTCSLGRGVAAGGGVGRWREIMTNLDSILKSRDFTFLTTVCIVKAKGFSSSHVQMWDLNHKKGWVPKKCFWMVLLEKTLESLLNCKRIKSVTPKGNQHWIFIGRIDGWSWSSNTLATRCKESIQRERPWFWKRLRAWGEGSHRGYGG